MFKSSFFWGVTFLFFSFPFSSFGQIKKGPVLSIESNLQYGRILKHTSKLTFDLEKNSPGFETNFLFQTHGRRAWQHVRNYPLFGLALYYYQFGNPDQLGQAVAFLPNLNLKPVQWKRLDLIVQVGTGLAWLNKTFDRLDNPRNNAISSHWNNITAFKFGFNWRYQPQWTMTGGLSLIHFSNGSTRLPNFGLNVLATYLGIRYTPRPLKPEDYTRYDKDETPFRRIGLNAQFGLTYVEMLSIGGPRHPIYFTSLGGHYHFGRYNRVTLGLAYEFNRGVYEFGFHTYDFVDSKDARRRSSRYILYGGYEFLFGPLAIELRAGWYLNRDAFLLRNSFYTKLISRYYFPPIPKTDLRLYANAQIKSHYFVAEYLAFGLGLAF